MSCHMCDVKVRALPLDLNVVQSEINLRMSRLEFKLQQLLQSLAISAQKDCLNHNNKNNGNTKNITLGGVSYNR